MMIKAKVTINRNAEMKNGSCQLAGAVLGLHDYLLRGLAGSILTRAPLILD